MQTNVTGDAEHTLRTSWLRGCKLLYERYSRAWTRLYGDRSVGSGQLPSSWQLTSSAPLDSGPDSLVERLSYELPSSSLGLQVLCGTPRGIVIAVISICWSLSSHSLQSWTGSDIPPVVFLRGVFPTAWLLSNQYFNNRIMISHLERITYCIFRRTYSCTDSSETSCGNSE